MTTDEFVTKYNGKTLGYPDGSFVGECLSLVKVYIKEMFGINPPPSGTNSAYGYWSKFPSPLDTIFEKVVNEITSVPKKGDLIIWKPTSSNKYGHIDIWIDGDVNEFLGFDQNFYGRHAHLQKHSYNNVIGWLHPKETMTDLQKNALEALQRAVDQGLYGNIESAGRAVVDLVRDNKEYKKHIGVQENANLALALQVEKEQAKVKTLSDSITEKDEAFRIATAEIGKRNLKIEDLEKTIDGMNTTPPTANDLTSFELLKLLINKLWQPKSK